MPIIVIIPPNILAKAKGIRIILGDRFCLMDVFNATGNISAKAPTLFIKAEKIAARAINRRVEIYLDAFIEDKAYTETEINI